MSCTTCGAEWGEGAFTLECDECGGGALVRPCVVCGGRCGAWWRRAVIDSNDARVAHWGGGCALPDDVQERLLRAMGAGSVARPAALDLLSIIHPARGAGQDRVAILEHEGGVAIVLADGAGGTGDGAAAAERVLACAAEGLAARRDPVEILAACDRALAADGVGLSTAVLALVDGGRVRGASVGDSAAWLVGPDASPVELTAHQARRPLLGDGAAIPIAFDAPLGAATLLVATDGLFTYAPRAAIVAAVARAPTLAAASSALVASARLPSGGLQDDLALALCRVPRGSLFS